jgi:hypothetical protein
MEVSRAMKIPIWLVLVFGIAFSLPSRIFAQSSSEEVWEYSPYRIRLWISMSPSLGVDEAGKRELHRRIGECCEIEFGATANIEVGETPDALYGSILYHLDELTVEKMLSRELVLMLSKSDQAKEKFLAMQPRAKPSLASESRGKELSKRELEELKAKEDAEARAASLNSIRTLDSVMERIPKIAIPALDYRALQRDLLPYCIDKDIPNLAEKLKPLLIRKESLESKITEYRKKGATTLGNSDLSIKFNQALSDRARLDREIQTVQPLLDRKEKDVKNWKALPTQTERYVGTMEQLRQDLGAGTFFAALVPKSEVSKFKDISRSIPARFPWQPEALLRDKDKIVLVSIDRQGELMSVKVKELDAFVRRIGPLETMQVQSLQEIPQTIAHLQRRAFTPMARIEENDNRTAVLRVRAAGLAISEESPIHIRSGDVVAPYIRRDDLNGNPISLQNLAFTYIAVTEPIDSARFYGAIFAASRGALVTARNRRTRRVALKIQPRFPASQLKLGIRQNPSSVVPGAEIYLRTPGTDELKMVGRTDWRGIIDIQESASPTITYNQPTSSSVPSIAKARSTVATGEPIPEGGFTQEAPTADDAQKSPSQSTKPPTSTITIHVPLYLYYVKNGETLLARLPIITGYRDRENADLPDDRLRLQAEGFLKGLQGEMLDIVARRKILESRIQRKIEEGKLDDASTLIDDLKKVKNYESMSTQIQAIQRRVFVNESGYIPAPVEKRIEDMLDTTRVLMQKYLQTDLVRELEIKLIEAKKKQ